MSKKTALGGLFLAFGLSILSACSTVGSTPPPPTGNQTVHSQCNVPQIPACRK